jgi:hypothetical protein
MIRRRLTGLGADRIEKLRAEISDYLKFRGRVGRFLDDHFSGICTQKCYQSRLSACCSKDGIITFFADMAVNALASSAPALDILEQAIFHPADEFKCIYLLHTGCAWKIKPVVCEFFLCDEAEQKAFTLSPEARACWQGFENEKRLFTWPDRPVLFESLERYFMDMGCVSPLMYIHNSPGLVKIRKMRDKPASDKDVKTSSPVQ